MNTPTRITIPLRGEVWEVQFDPSLGAEIQKVRPAVVVGRNRFGRLPLQIVVPVTDWKSSFVNYTWFVHLSPTESNGLKKASGADSFQVKSVSFQRFVRKIGVLTPEDTDRIAVAVAVCVRYRSL